MLKPSAGHKYGPETSMCTNPEAVAATIKAQTKANPGKIILTEAVFSIH